MHVNGKLMMFSAPDPRAALLVLAVIAAMAIDVAGSRSIADRAQADPYAASRALLWQARGL